MTEVEENGERDIVITDYILGRTTTCVLEENLTRTPAEATVEDLCWVGRMTSHPGRLSESPQLEENTVGLVFLHSSLE